MRPRRAAAWRSPHPTASSAGRSPPRRTPDPARGRRRPRSTSSPSRDRDTSITRDDVLAAREAIDGRLHRTPTFSSATLRPRVHLKAELFQRTGRSSRVASSSSLSRLSEEERRGASPASAGNHARALAYCSALEGIDALLVMWRTASEAKIAATRGYGAEVDLDAWDGDVRAARRASAGDRPDARAPFDSANTIAGQGGRAGDRRGRADVDVVVVPVGGGGLISGIATALPGVRVVGVEPVQSNALCGTRGRPAGAGHPDVDRRRPRCAVRRRASCGLRRSGDHDGAGREEEIEAAMRLLYERAKLPAGPPVRSRWPR